MMVERRAARALGPAPLFELKSAEYRLRKAKSTGAPDFGKESLS